MKKHLHVMTVGLPKAFSAKNCPKCPLTHCQGPPVQTSTTTKTVWITFIWWCCHICADLLVSRGTNATTSKSCSSSSTAACAAHRRSAARRAAAALRVKPRSTSLSSYPRALVFEPCVKAERARGKVWWEVAPAWQVVVKTASELVLVGSRLCVATFYGDVWVGRWGAVEGRCAKSILEVGFVLKRYQICRLNVFSDMHLEKNNTIFSYLHISIIYVNCVSISDVNKILSKVILIYLKFILDSKTVNWIENTTVMETSYQKHSIPETIIMWYPSVMKLERCLKSTDRRIKMDL